MIEIRDLYKYYGTKRAVGPLSARIEKGEIVGLLGLNGAGKTTTLRVLACDLLPTSGHARVDGVDVVERPDEVRAKIGYLPDTPPLYDEMRVHEFLQFAARLRGLDTDVRSRVGDVEEAIGLTEVRDEVISSLSHGFRQRVGIAQAIVHKPALVVLDEPISGLDPKQIVDMRSLVRQLGGDHTVLISSHILSEISETCDRLLVIRNGEIIASDTEEGLRSRVAEGGGHRIELVVQIDGSGVSPEQVITKLGGVSGVSSVNTIAIKGEGEGVVGFEVASAHDVRRELSKTVVDSGLGLLGLAQSEKELENVFLRLARSEDEAARASAPAPAEPPAEQEASEQQSAEDSREENEE